MERLTAAIAEGGHSVALLKAIAQRERELSEIERTLNLTNDLLVQDPGLLRDFATNQLSTLPNLLSRDVPRARAELSRHVTSIVSQ